VNRPLGDAHIWLVVEERITVTSVVYVQSIVIVNLVNISGYVHMAESLQLFHILFGRTGQRLSVWLKANKEWNVCTINLIGSRNVRILHMYNSAQLLWLV